MAYTFKQSLLPSSKVGLKSPYSMEPETYTVHNTYNDALAQSEINYMNSNTSPVSYHYAVDHIEVVQGILENRNAFAAGDGARGRGNRTSIHIEICFSKSGGPRYVQAEENAVKFLASRLHARGWGIDRVRKHQDWSGKYCPHRILAEGRWNSFLSRVQAELNRLSGVPTVVKPVSNPRPVATPAPAPSGPDYKTTSIVAFLASIGENSSFENRAQLAAKHGIEKYAGTAAQNTALLAKLVDAHKNPAAKAELNEPNYKTDSIVTFLASVGEDNSFANRAKLAASFGISGYRGTAAQNTQLLEKLKASYKGTLKPAGRYAGGDPRTGSIADYMKSIDQDSSFANRSKIAAELGISGYKGTAAQNERLLDLMRGGAGGGSPTRPTAPKKVNKYAGGDKRTSSVIDYMKSINQSSSFANRAKIAAELGIKGYKGTAAQNKQLLDKMRG